MIENYNPIVKKNNVLAPFWDNAFIHKNASTGAVASFQDGAGDVPIREMSAEINPVQDLHGYDYPWPAGGGKNLIGGDNIIRFNRTVYGVTYSAQEDGGIKASGTVTDKSWNYSDFYTTPDLYGLSVGDSFALSCFGNDVRLAIYFQNDSTVLGIFTSDTAPTGTVPEGTNRLRMLVYCKISSVPSAGEVINKTFYPQLEKASTPSSTFHPYSNICPITGYTGADVSVTGKNLVDVNNQNNISAYVDNHGDVKFSTAWKTTEPVPVCSGKSYVLSGLTSHPNTGTDNYILFDENKSSIGNLVFRVENYPLVIPDGVAYVQFCWKNDEKDTVMFEQSSTATDYEPFGHTYSISFPSSAGTVYSGYVTINKDGSGTLVVDKKTIVLDGSESWNQGNYGNGFRYYTTGQYLDAKNNQYCKTSISQNKSAPGTLWINIDTATKANQIDVWSYASVTTLNTLAKWKAYLQENNVTVLYELASPVTYIIPANQIECITFLSGLNNVWINTGDITNLVYYSDAQTLNEETEMLKKYVSANTITDTASGTIASFTDGAADIPLKSLEVGINLVQDLHGYDNPWPEGGGKNLISYPYVTTGTTWNGMAVTESGGKVTIKGTQNGVSPFVFAGGVTVKGGVTYTINPNVTGTGGIPFTIYDTNTSTLFANTSRNPVTFTPTEDHTVLIYLNPSSSAQGASYDFSVQPQLEVGSSATEWTPYSNICPISGYTSANVTRTGKNLLRMQGYKGDGYNAPAGTKFNLSYSYHDYVDNNDGTYTYQAVDGWEHLSLLVPVKTTGTYYLYFPKITGQPTLCMFRLDENMTTVGAAFSLSNPLAENGSYSQSVVMNFTGYILISAAASRSKTITFTTPMVQYNSAVTEYEPFGEVYPITFPSEAGTVYGGTLTINQDGSGSLVVDREGADLGTLAWRMGNVNKFYSTNTSTNLNYKYSTSVKMICSQYKYVGTRNSSPWYGNNGELTAYFLYSQPTIREIYIVDERYTTAEEFKTAMSGVQLVYELNTPISIHLTASQITTLLGINNVLADCNGDVSLEYVANAKLYIAKKISEALS